jgi:DNA helicase-2/ATP-dependent DNA helicase PcrA
MKMHPEIAEQIRSRFKCVILDEYQDTSSSQVLMLQQLFKDFPIMAVGDPNQSIYAFRGASSSNILNFLKDFSSVAGGTPLTLSTSWRNDEAILDFANLIAEPLSTGGFEYPKLQSKYKTLGVPGVKGDVKVNVFDDDDQEMEAVVEFIKAKRKVDENGRTPTCAIISPKRSQFEKYRSRLLKDGIPVEVVGLAGLFELKEVQAVLNFAKICVDPKKNSTLVGVMVSDQYGISLVELKKLHDIARQKDVSISHLVRQMNGKNSDHYKIVLEKCGKTAAEKVSVLSRRIHQMQEHLGSNVVDFFNFAVQNSNILDEVSLQEALNPVQAQSMKSSISCFVEQVQRYQSFNSSATVEGFFGWVQQILKSESGGDVPQKDLDEHCVQLITAHGAKGLEWDAVASIGNTAMEFYRSRKLPVAGGVFKLSTGIEDSGWLTSPGTLPYPLRKDCEYLPRQVPKLDAPDEIAEFAQVNGEFELEQRRRLAYVIFTRARHSLFVTASYYKADGKMPRQTSVFFDELYRERLQMSEDEYCTHLSGVFENAKKNRELSADAKSGKVSGQAVVFPKSELSEGQKVVAALIDDIDRLDGDACKNSELIDLAQIEVLIEKARAEEARRENWQDFVAIPPKLSATQYTALKKDELQFKKDMVRRVPTDFNAGTDKGTRFHAWVEKQFSQALDAFSEETTENVDLQKLIDIFTNSKYQWLNQKNIAVEQEVNYKHRLEHDSEEHIFIARIDAVFENFLPEVEAKVLIVDWKTFRTPSKGKLKKMQPQLEIYKNAWLSAHPDLCSDDVICGFYFVPSDELTVGENVLY